MAPGFFKECHIVVLNSTGYRTDYTSGNLRKWVENGGGHIAFKEILTDQTTHVVMDEQTWMDQGPFIQQIFTTEQTNENGRKIAIVSFDWLQECLENRVKRGEGPFKWKNLAGKVLKDAAREAKAAAKQAGKEAGNTQGLMAEAFLGATEGFVDQLEKKRIDKRKKQEEADRAEEAELEQEQFEAYRKKMRIPDMAAVFKRGAKRAKSEILSDNHHIYMDNTGFHFDVTITKVDFRHNKNQHYTLTIYESNSEPQTYAFNCKFGGTNELPRNDVIAAIGCNFPTAFHAFKKVFKEKTGGAWEHRVENAKNNGKFDGDFKNMPFEYLPPAYGTKGELMLVEAATAAEEEASAAAEKKALASFDNLMSGVAEAAGEDSPFKYPFDVPAEEGEVIVAADEQARIQLEKQKIAVEDLDAQKTAQPKDSAMSGVDLTTIPEKDAASVEDHVDLAQDMGETQVGVFTQIAEQAKGELMSDVQAGEEGSGLDFEVSGVGKKREPITEGEESQILTQTQAEVEGDDGDELVDLGLGEDI